MDVLEVSGLRLTMHAHGHGPALGLFVSVQAGFAYDLGALAAFLGVNRHLKTNHAPNDVGYLFIVQLLLGLDH